LTPIIGQEMAGLLLLSSLPSTDGQWIVFEYSTQIVGDAGTLLYVYDFANRSLHQIENAEEGYTFGFGFGNEDFGLGKDLVVEWDQYDNLKVAYIFESRSAEVYASENSEQPWVLRRTQ